MPRIIKILWHIHDPSADLFTLKRTFRTNQTITTKFLNKFGCYGLIGPESPFQSEKIRAWVVYMPKNFYYPWHHHPAEEMYLCLAGEAVFQRENCPDTRLGSGGIMEHSANQPHSMETLEHPIMSYVVWRNEFGTKPVLTFEDAR